MKVFSRFKDRIIKRISKRISEQNFLDKGIKLKPNCFISGSKITGSVSFGESCKFYRTQIEGNITIGRYTSIWGPNTIITSKFNNIKIGSFCSIARNVSIQEYNHKIDTLSTYHMNSNVFGEDLSEDLYSNGKIEIGNDVWIGAGTVVLSGVKIGNGAVIGANSLVSKDVPPFAVVGGNPVKIIKYRFPQEVIDELQAMKWWDWSLDQIWSNRNKFIGPIKKDLR